LDGVSFRPATAADLPALAALYAASARALGPTCYGPEQVAAWARFGRESEAFSRYVLDADTWLASDAAGQVLGFSGVGPTGEVHSLYVRHDRCRRGLGTRLLVMALARAEARGVTGFAAWVTPLSRRVFERVGFRLVRTVREPFEGVEFERYRVERSERAVEPA
jgi:putative acetyltransferase